MLLAAFLPIGRDRRARTIARAPARGCAARAKPHRARARWHQPHTSACFRSRGRGYHDRIRRRMAYDQELAAMQGWLDATDRIALEHFAVDVPYTAKDDGTPVTAADIAIEDALRYEIEGRYPQDAVIGEEGGTAGGSTGRRWIVDPIDGTKNYRRG